MNSKTILIVDDEVSLANLTMSFLTNKGYEVKIASNGEEALKVLKYIIPDLILLDINMPKMSGLTLYKKFLTEYGKPPCPVIFLTARAELKELLTEDDQNVDFVEKPFRAEILLSKIEKFLSNEDVQ